MQIECIFGMKLFEGKRGYRSTSGTKVTFITVLRQALLRSMAEAGNDNFCPCPCYFLNLVTSTGKQGKPYN
jgi:hypothetical protein